MHNYKIGIIGAMAPEVAILHDRMNVESETEKAGMKFWQGTIGTKDIVLVQSGIGKVNAAVCAQILIDCFEVTHILNTGIAGSLNDALNIGDIVISTDAVLHDFDITAFGYAKGEVPGIGSASFRADETFRAKAVEAAKAAAPDIQVFEGRIVTGDQFISSQARKEAIIADFGGMCTEMEGGAIAQTAWINHIPFVIIRAISDNANDTAHRDYAEIEAEAAAHSAAITARILELM
ncbi:MAG: 5'-methylthioadenosine/adenosylhomocysteine nucleosidase [Solobacterium sp.]|nr:5'-methylthioadenosine/adenosylhomocysteine nucleosidase [Solobacterium sp.]